MKKFFNVALNHENESILITLSEQGASEPKILLGDTEYSIQYSGPEAFFEPIKNQLTEQLQHAAVTKETLESSLQNFGVLAVSELQDKLKRAVSRAAMIGKGLHAVQKNIEANEISPLSVAQGRMIGEHYYLETYQNELGRSHPMQNIHLFKLWKRDNTNFSLPDWHKLKQQQWEQSDKSIDFLPWLYQQSWQQSQTSDDFFTWFLRKDHSAFHIPTPFDKWQKEVRSDIVRHFGVLLDKNSTEEEILNLWLEQHISALNLNDQQFIEFTRWKQSQTADSFSDWLLKKEWEEQKPSLSFEDWREQKTTELLERWEQLGFKNAGMDFHTWRVMQDPTLISEDGLRSFIQCDEKMRSFFKLDLDETSRRIYRNEQPYRTDYETTLHSGKGYAIFVIGPDQNVYAASHIPMVFHHSSFFADGSIIAGGELRMGLEGNYEVAKDEQDARRRVTKFKTQNQDPYRILLIKNEQKNTYLLVGNNGSGKFESMEISSRSTLGKTLQSTDFKHLTYEKRIELTDKLAERLGRTNPHDQLTGLSSKSGHYHPADEENYYMLKFWQSKGFDLTQIPFTLMGEQGSITYKNAQTYLDIIEKPILQRQKSQLQFESGKLQNQSHQLQANQSLSIVFNNRGECFLSPQSLTGLMHQDFVIAPKLPEFQGQNIVLKESIKEKIDGLSSKKENITKKMNQLDQLLMQKGGRARAKKQGRLALKAAYLSQIETINDSISRLNQTLEQPPRLGKQEIHGGGTVSTDDRGRVVKVDAKLDGYKFSEKEIETTLLNLKKQGTDLEHVALVTYDTDGQGLSHPSAMSWLLDRNHAKNSVDRYKSEVNAIRSGENNIDESEDEEQKPPTSP